MTRRLLCFLVLLSVARTAVAQTPPTAAVLDVAPTDPSLAPFAAAVERVLRARLDALHAVRVSAAPALSLADLQLATGCMGETAPCLRAVAQQLQLDVLFYTTVDHAGEERVVTVHSFDARGPGTIKQAQRQGPEADVVEEVEPMLRELLGLPPAPVIEGRVTARAPPRDPAMFVLSLSCFGAALVASVVGAIFGALELGSADDYFHTTVTNMPSADAANAALGRAQDQATAANVLFVVASVAAAAGIAFLVVDLTSGPPHAASHAAVSFVPAGPGIALRGSF